MKLSACILFGVACLSSAALGQSNEKPPAKPVPIAPRFQINDRDWPANFGEGSVCLWKDDSLAALSITIDDNWAPDHPWWLEMGRKYGLRLTWFVITGRVGTGLNWGTWDDFRKLFHEGHDVQSHTLTHLHTESPEWKGIEPEYVVSQRAIEKEIPGDKCLALAYPGGPNSALNDPEIAAKYYVCARGATGSVNSANQTNYKQTNSIGADIFIGDAKFPSQDLTTLLEKKPSGMGNYYRGWYCCHFHGVKPETREHLEQRFAVVKQKVQSGELWPGLFREVCQYGQERDTAHLETREASPARVVLQLTDKMDDARFDFPLTLKVRLDPTWTTVKAVQNSKEVEAKRIEHDGAVYALVQAVPDRGPLILTHADARP